jgi:crossover junction endodeoxyribonuclease RuvC
MRILGIDPGSSVTGYGVVELVKPEKRLDAELVHLAHGTLRPPRNAPLALRLAAIQAGLAQVIEDHSPDLAVVEQVFVSSSPRSALILGHARGVALAAAAAAGLPVEEYSAREIKQAVVGSGAAAKAEVQAMVKRILRLEARPSQDAADALAAAICRAHRGRFAELARSAPRRRSRARRSGGGFVLRLSR